MKKEKFKLPIGTIAKVKGLNPHGVKRNTLLKIVRHEDFGKWDYMVQFLPYEKHETLNNRGPYLENSHLLLTGTMRILYGNK